MSPQLIPSQNPAFLRRHVLSCENPKDLDVLFAAYMEAYQPSAITEQVLVEDMIGRHWRVRRLASLKQSMMQQAISEVKAEMDPADLAALDSDTRSALILNQICRHAKALKSLAQYEAGLRRNHKSSRALLLELKKSRPQPLPRKTPSPQAIALIELPGAYFPRSKSVR